MIHTMKKTFQYSQQIHLNFTVGKKNPTSTALAPQASYILHIQKK